MGRAIPAFKHKGKWDTGRPRQHPGQDFKIMGLDFHHAKRVIKEDVLTCGNDDRIRIKPRERRNKNLGKNIRIVSDSCTGIERGIEGKPGALSASGL